MISGVNELECLIEDFEEIAAETMRSARDTVEEGYPGAEHLPTYLAGWEGARAAVERRDFAAAILNLRAARAAALLAEWITDDEDEALRILVAAKHTEDRSSVAS